MLPIFFGHDERAEAGTTVFVRSAIAHAKKPLALIPISRLSTGDVREGSNAFTFRRFLVPYLTHWTGYAVFVDGSDMLCRADLNELMALADNYSAVQVVKREYRTRHSRKYVGTQMEADNLDYPLKQAASVMLINCGHYAWRQVTPEFVAKAAPLDLLQLRFIDPKRIGELPATWNWLADEDGVNPEAKLVHFTAGSPGFEHYRHSPMADEWHAALAAASTVTG